MMLWTKGRLQSSSIIVSLESTKNSSNLRHKTSPAVHLLLNVCRLLNTNKVAKARIKTSFIVLITVSVNYLI